MNDQPRDRLRARTEGHRRARLVTAWAAAAGTALTVGFGALVAQSDTTAAAAEPANVEAVPLPGYDSSAAPTTTAPPSTTVPTTTAAPDPTTSAASSTRSSQPLTPPAQAPTLASGSKRHASSGAS